MSFDSALRQIRYKLEEVERLSEELGDMCEAWEHGSPEDQACNDPGLQYEKSNELETASEELKDLFRSFIEGEY